MTKDAYFQVRVTQQELDVLKAIADKLNISLSEYARRMMIPTTSALLSGDEEKVKRMFTSTGQVMFTQFNIQKDT